MHSMIIVLSVLVGTVAVHAAVLPMIGDLRIVTTGQSYISWSIDIPSFFDFVSGFFTAQLKVIFSRNHHVATDNDPLRRDDASSKEERTVSILINLSIAILVFAASFALSLGIYTMYRRASDERQESAISGRQSSAASPRHNSVDPERQGSQQPPSAHPQPGDIELGTIHARSLLHWPLASNSGNPTTRYGSPLDSSMPEGHAETQSPGASNRDADTEGRDITKAVTPKTHATNPETYHTV
ncbi:hypothetical protein NUW58_g932 [Xylaria curta]|uniref:Uncharacterized protein n=1 Tax=Xylaria curta TaxID=42375 RepID=A0ACC1PMI8_9PEZI|nr:hypothetical protein NUW58_g932 [Xylaria curta]